MSKSDLTADELRRLLSYDPKTGVFTRRVRMGNAFPAGQRVGTPGARCYLVACVRGVSYLAHRLAWLYMTGAWPTGSVDHIDGDPRNNSFTNLRDVTHGLNLQNQRRKHINNQSGLLGVYPKGGKWAAQITTDGKQRCLGTFDAPQHAHAAYLAAKREAHSTCTM